MTNKTTKSALFTSSISLLLCFAMLLGTTFAWFTDSATSARNRIQAGNLDVKLLMWNGTDYTDISEGTGDIFAEAEVATNSKNTLWEPGKTQVVYLAIENAGNLDLKYNVDIKAYKDAANNVNEIDMTPAMRYAITPDAKNGAGVTSWDSANAKEVALGMNKTQSENVMLAKGQKHYFALSVHMLEDADNEYQDASVLFDLIVSATQISSENDSFGPDYDKSAENATLVSTAEEFKTALDSGEDVTLAGVIDMENATVAIPDNITIFGGTIENAILTVADDNTASFNGVKFSNSVTIQAKGDGGLDFDNCEFDIEPSKLSGNSRAAAIIGANQNHTLDLNLDGCTFNYNKGNSDDKWNAAIFMWSGVDNCVVKNCTFNDYGFVGIKLMNAADGADIIFEGNTFNMSKQSDENWHHNNAVQIMPQHDKAMNVKFINNTFTGDYEDGKIVATIEVMHGGTLSKLAFTQSGNTVNGVAATTENFAINAQ